MCLRALSLFVLRADRLPGRRTCTETLLADCFPGGDHLLAVRMVRDDGVDQLYLRRCMCDDTD